MQLWSSSEEFPAIFFTFHFNFRPAVKTHKVEVYAFLYQFELVKRGKSANLGIGSGPCVRVRSSGPLGAFILDLSVCNERDMAPSNRIKKRKMVSQLKDCVFEDDVFKDDIIFIRDAVVYATVEPIWNIIPYLLCQSNLLKFQGFERPLGCRIVKEIPQQTNGLVDLDESLINPT
ncbi:Uncharacterized protein Fot_11112 [Forsythia ovata]|uniref:Uncharacterized protein n=1 Tax=Forsythia ovata TaxID=205694 RepID=A0ABD1WIS4_9LAMI